MSNGSSKNYNRTYYNTIKHVDLTQSNVRINFISSPAVMGSDVFYMDEAAVRTKWAMINSATKNVLLVGKNQINQQALYQLASVGEFDVLITDKAPDESFTKLAKASGVELIVASNEGA
ncbi:MAG: hypothetical protein ABJO30_00010 [Hyphomicrobiales bacterium]